MVSQLLAIMKFLRRHFLLLWTTDNHPDTINFRFIQALEVRVRCCNNSWCLRRPLLSVGIFNLYMMPGSFSRGATRRIVHPRWSRPQNHSPGAISFIAVRRSGALWFGGHISVVLATKLGWDGRRLEQGGTAIINSELFWGLHTLPVLSITDFRQSGECPSSCKARGSN